MRTDKMEATEPSSIDGNWVITEGKVKKGGVKKVLPSPRPVVPPQGKKVEKTSQGKS